MEFPLNAPSVTLTILEILFSVLYVGQGFPEFIRERQAEGYTVEQVIELLDKKYGHRV